jgi:hypothetical protein
MWIMDLVLSDRHTLVSCQMSDRASRPIMRLCIGLTRWNHGRGTTPQNHYTLHHRFGRMQGRTPAFHRNCSKMLILSCTTDYHGHWMPKLCLADVEGLYPRRGHSLGISYYCIPSIISPYRITTSYPFIVVRS